MQAKFASWGGIRRAATAALLAALIMGPVAIIHADASYKVQFGDTLTGIAARYGVTVDAIAAANGLSTRTIYIGQTLTIPSSAAPAATAKPAPPTNGTYIVVGGDNLTNLAARFGVTREALAAANGITPTSLLYVGQVLKIPRSSQPAQPAPTRPSTPTPTPTPTSSPVAATTPLVAATTTPQPVSAPSGADAGKPIRYTVQAGDNLASIAAKFNTTVEALVRMNNLPDSNYVYVGQVLTIVKGNDQGSNAPSQTPLPEPAPPMGQFGPKWVDVTLSTQTMIAYEGQTAVFTSKVSSGVDRHPTVEGVYRVYAKYAMTRMKGGEGAEHYDIPNVPYTMYFYTDYALHGAWWHNNFGHPMSHGCVNLPDDVAKWLYNWAPMGTMVVTHK